MPPADPAPLADQVGYLAVPVVTSDRPGPWPGVVLVHDVLGLGDDMREQADWLAAAGHVVAVPDLYEGRSAIRCLRATFAQLHRQRGPAFDRLDAVRSALAADPRCTGRVGVIGFCMGGGFALLLAGRAGWSAAGVNYGPVPDDVEDVLRGACPVVASFGGRDRGFTGAAQKLRAAADAAGVPADVKEYPHARHGFMNRISVASPLTPLLKVAGVGYDHDAAADARRRILGFFDEHLRDPVGPG
ncbi:dienelactone hydrolase family protein [Modestobacter sp. NPDC049651]|uniref:dienelactone hydrolase family protein n=1 Tax=unclassified Modestobacter TaxID=2643866 RepID=UPI0033EB9028